MVALSETWLSAESQFSLLGFHIKRQIRGDVLLAVILYMVYNIVRYWLLQHVIVSASIYVIRVLRLLDLDLYFAKILV